MSRRNRIDTSSYKTFGEISERLDEIVKQVRRKDIPLESSLDLFDEAIALGQKAVDFVDTDAVTSEESVRADRAAAAHAQTSTTGGSAGESESGA